MFLVAKRKIPGAAFGQRLRKRREAAGLTQAQLGAAVGMSAPGIARLELSPSANPTLDTLRKLADALGCPVAELVTDGG